MKLVIDISDETYKCVMDGTYCGTLYDALKNGVPVDASGDCISRTELLKKQKIIIDEHGLAHKIVHIGKIIDAPSIEPENCGDCISRRSIIGKCEDTAEATSESEEINAGFIMALDFIADYAKHLPSVEPERIINNKVHLCESCKYKYPDCPSSNTDSIFGDGNDNICCCNKYECKSSVEPERKMVGWIPIRFKSPQQGQRVFISTIKGTIHDEIWDMNRIYHYATDGCWYRNWFVVAWMPFILKPYKMDVSDE